MLKCLIILFLLSACGQEEKPHPKPRSKLNATEKALLQERLDVVGKGRVFCSGIPCLHHEDDGDSALWMGLMSLVGECYEPSSIQSEDGRLWRSPLRVNRPELNTNTFSRDMFLGYLAMQVACPDIESLKLAVKYLQENDYKLCPVNKNSACNAHYLQHRTFWAIIGHLYERANLSPPLASIQAYAGDITQIGAEAKLARIGYELHLVATMLLVYQHIGIEDEVLDNQRTVIYNRDPRNSFYSFLKLGQVPLVAKDVLDKCKTNDVGTDYAWRRASSEKAWERDAGHGCWFLINKLLEESK